MKKTSLSHPLQIAVVAAGSELGRVGITFCPGKHASGKAGCDREQRSGSIRPWYRHVAMTVQERSMDWFESLTGFRETSYNDTRAKLKVEGGRLQSLVNGKSYGIGEL